VTEGWKITPFICFANAPAPGGSPFFDPGTEVLSFGGCVLGQVTPDITAFAEVCVQTGTAFDAVNMDQDALGFQVGAKMAFPASKAWVELGIVSLSGDDPGTADYEEFQSYENNDDLVILESNEWGMDLDSNLFAIKVKGGIQLEKINLIGKIATAKLDDDQGLGEDDLGIEFDATVEFPLNKNAKLYFTFAMVTGNDVVDTAYGADDSAMVFLLGTQGAY
jgi:hypothetical protein